MITPNEFFDEIYCINLNKRVDRWEESQKKFIREQIHVNRWTAVDGKISSLKREFDDIIYENESSQIKRPTTYAILKTYIELYEHILKYTDYNKILIFQDDVNFHKDFKKRFDHAIFDLPEDWDMWYLGASQYEFSNINILIEGKYENFYVANMTEGLFAFALKVDLIESILLPALKQYLYSADRTHNIFTQNINKYNIYVSHPTLCGHEQGFSDNYDIMFDETTIKSLQWKHRIYDKKIYK